jgi:hypothetical protein
VVRSWLQLSIFASHAFGSFIGGWMIHAAWGLSDSSEQFVLLSGLALGSVFTLKAARGGHEVAVADMARRTWRLYLTHLVVLALFGAMVFWAERALPLPGEAERLGWSWLREAAGRGGGRGADHAVAAGLHGHPADLRLVHAGAAAVPVAGGADRRLGAGRAGRALRGGAAVRLGDAAARRRHRYRLRSAGLAGAVPRRRLPGAPGAALGRARRAAPTRGLVVAAVAMLAFGLWFRMVEYGWIAGPAALDTRLVLGKERLAVPRLLHALSIAYLVAAFVPRKARWMHGRAGRALAAVGWHSLHVFCLGLFLSYGAATAFRLWPDAPWWLDPLLIGAGAAVLIGFARWADRRRAAGAAAPPARGAAAPSAAASTPAAHCAAARAGAA